MPSNQKHLWQPTINVQRRIKADVLLSDILLTSSNFLFTVLFKQKSSLHIFPCMFSIFSYGIIFIWNKNHLLNSRELSAPTMPSDREFHSFTIFCAEESPLFILNMNYFHLISFGLSECKESVLVRTFYGMQVS